VARLVGDQHVGSDGRYDLKAAREDVAPIRQEDGHGPAQAAVVANLGHYDVVELRAKAEGRVGRIVRY